MLRGPGRKVPPGVLFQCFWAPGSECPRECFLALLGPKNAKKHSKSTLWGTRSQVPKTHTEKALRGGTFRPGPLSTPVNGGPDRKVFMCFSFPDSGPAPTSPATPARNGLTAQLLQHKGARAPTKWVARPRETIAHENSGPEKGVITKGVFSLEESLESLQKFSRVSPENLERF